MTTDDFMFDQVERSQKHQTRRRRHNQSRRRHVYAAGGLLLIVALALGAPSLVSHSSIGRSILIQSLGGYGLDADVDSMRIGWVTPLRVSGIAVRGEAGSELVIDQIDMDMTVGDLLRSSTDELGQVAVRGIHVSCSVADGRCSLEDDFQPLLQTSGEGGTRSASLKLQDISVHVTDAVSGGTWQVDQSNADVAIAADRVDGTFAGVLTEPGGGGGSLQGAMELVGMQGGGPADRWLLHIRSDSLPLSVVSLIRRRFPETAATIPGSIDGDATGDVRLTGTPDGAIEATVQGLEIRNLTASDQQSRVWNNRLATLDGDLVLVSNRVIGRHLRASTDFASATIDGAFSRTFSLVGANDNPLCWLDAIDGTATAEIDLAAFDRSLPGILPLREEAQLVSGRVQARVDSSPGTTVRRSQLKISSDALRARARGRAVVIDPIKLTATVSSDRGQVKAEHFEWRSTFGSAIGQGDLRSGNADFEIDFGRLIAMVRPIVQISETTLAGAASGNVKWNASPDNIWRLSGSADASNLLVTLPGGHNVKRPSMQGTIEAVGRWGGQSLVELSQARLTLASSGMNVEAELVRPVRHPSMTLPMPIRISGQGRIDTVVETLGPWLPPEIHSSAGGFTLSADAEVSSLTTRLTTAAIELRQPRMAYGQRHFSQPNVKIHFDGDYVFPSQNLHARSVTIVGEAFSLAAKGQATAEEIDMDIKWRAKLERLQGSVRNGIATRNRSPVRQVGYHRSDSPIETDDWLVTGDCQGSLLLKSRDRLLEIELQSAGKDIAVIQPPKASARSLTVGPMPHHPGRNRSPQPESRARVVWSEPNLTVDGLVRYDISTGGMIAQGVQVAGDWFATTLRGNILWNETTSQVQLSGPARLKMNEVANRLSSLAGIRIDAEGIHETPLEIRAAGQDTGEIAVSVQGNLGWEAGRVAGVTFGPASIPVRLTETSVEIAPCRVPVGQGNLNLAGQVHYRPGPLWMHIEPGVIAESIRLTPDMTTRWLKYLAPLAADAARIDGTVGAEIDEAMIVFDQPQQTRVSGRLNIGSVQMTAGPLSNQILAGVDQLKSLARVLTSQPEARTDRTWITMPAQTVDFTVDHGIVTHDRLFVEIDRAQVVTSGRVALDGRLDMDAQIPLDSRWLGSDLQGLAGHSVTLPIDGTLSRPSLDSSGVRRVVAQLGAQAVQSTAENYLQQQLNRGFDKIFGR